MNTFSLIFRYINLLNLTHYSLFVTTALVKLILLLYQTLFKVAQDVFTLHFLLITDSGCKGHIQKLPFFFILDENYDRHMNGSYN